MAETKVKASINRFQAVGTLAELNLAVETKEVTLKANGTEKKVTCKTIGKKDFKNPSLTVECVVGDKTVIVGGSFFQTHELKLDDKGKVVDNPRFKALNTIIEDYVPRIKDSANPTRVKLDGSLTVNEYANDQGEFKSFPQINIFQCSSTGVPEEDIAEGEISGIIRAIKDEVKGEEAEETGRLEVEFYTFDNRGETYPIKLIVEEDLKDDFKDLYENGTSCKLYYEQTTKQVGGQVATTGGGFGRREKKTTSGFTVTEFSVFKGDEAFEEENQYFIAKADMKKAMESRAITIEQKIKDAKDKASKPKETKKASGLGNKASKLSETKVEEDDTDSEMPF